MRGLNWVRLFRQATLLLGVIVFAALQHSLVRAEVIEIDPSQPPASILPPAELEKLTVLQNTKELFLYSRVSSDDSVVVFGSAALGSATGGEPEPPQLGFLNITDGSLQPVNPAFLMTPPESEVVWRDAQTAVYLSKSQAGTAVLVSLDRTTGSVAASELSLPGAPISLAPGGARLIAEVAISESITLTAVDLTTGALEPLLAYPQGGSPSSIAWSEDGNKLALVRTLVPPELALDPDQAMELATQDVLGLLPLEENPFFQGNVVDVFDLANHEVHLSALKAAGGDGYLFQRVSWSPDGQTLLAKMVRPSQPEDRANPITFFPDRAHFRLYDANFVLLETVDRLEIEAAQTTQAFFASPDEVIFAAPNGPTFRLYSYQRTSGEFRRLPTAAGTFADAPYGYQILATHQSRQLIYNQSSFLQPPEIYRLGLDDGEPQALTAINAAAAAVNQIRVSEVSLRLSEKVTRTGYLLRPANILLAPQTTPLVLYQQGGPGGAMTNRWGATPDEPFSLLPNFGISVFFMPFFGREGLGPKFVDRLVQRRKFGAADIDEAAQAVQALVTMGYVERDQVGITGCSYGGYFTSQSLVLHPNLYAAANAQCSPLDLLQWWEGEGRLLVSYAEGRLPTESEWEYRRDSPLYQADDIRTPLLLFHGEDDFLPVATVKNFHDRIVAAGTPATLLVFQQEGHTLTHPTSRFLAAQSQIAWFRKYLLPTSESTGVCSCAAPISVPTLQP
ncbi:MAG: prolyl oligopeptidase family serine peptidase [Caldilineaceae bacterium]|nr:prolyl oligopeptidase family serine peptidase [Caldilineaceae bacterium]